MISGRPHAPSTMKNNKYFLEGFLNKHEYATFETLRTELLDIDAVMFAKREKLWVVVLGFTKWLAEEGYTEKEVPEKILKLKPKRHVPARKLSLREDELDLMEKACNNTYERAIVILLSHTGVRSSEFFSWTMENISLERREIKFRGKGNKDRWVGLNSKAFDALEAYLRNYPPINDKEHIFRNKHGERLKPDGLGSRVRKIGDRVGIHAHPHCMRRSFVTINVAKGRSLVHLQLLAGHSDIKITRGYCMTSQQDAVDVIKDWD